MLRNKSDKRCVRSVHWKLRGPWRETEEKLNKWKEMERWSVFMNRLQDWILLTRSLSSSVIKELYRIFL